ncbi:alpha amylase C-terminal domain-containing protein [Lusitaniella coriacea LEGE 07157]|uniref:Alpha amylase C-terminal domain-containing protein n=1 Tax=Lusitaniella coriacea LEGE 07157 TaxID=945747 RepID=A0A8J7E251_9CYAN|nr:alpha-amylase family glycosyl hydrolase [Lusitaniella coriacea]MBE9118256.1 alpha amylase C-terminal domain-containing protein [Lusitaniella coriacea LEGE 07157]
MVNTIEFKLLAPYNKEASLIGSFSNWEDIPMQKDKKGYFRTQVELEDGTYQYKFRVRSRSWFFESDQWIEVNDPCATNIDGPTQHGIVRIKEGQKIVDTYVWQHDNHPLPTDYELVIYEMHVSDFSGGEDDPHERGQYQHVIEKLNYLCDLGINAIELMPIKEYPGNYSWGYNPRYFFATETSYGTTEELKHLIDECHARGIRVLLDKIYNHSETSSPLTQIDHDYWYYHEPRDLDNSWGPEFNYEFYDETFDRKPAWEFVGDAVRFWIEEYHFDGIRYDAARQLANYDFMYWIVQTAKETAGSKPFYNVAEYIPEQIDITNIDGPMDGCWHESFYITVKAHICGDTFNLEQLKEVLDCQRQGYMGTTNVVNYLSNHDHERLMVELAKRDIFEEEAFRRLKLGVVLLMTAVGIPMVWMGEEFGDYHRRTPEPAKIEWMLLKHDLNRSLWQHYQSLIRLRRNNHALYTENIDFFYEDIDSKVLAYTRWNEEGSRVVVVANFSGNHLADYRIPHFPANGVWREWMGNCDVEAEEDRISIDLLEYEAKVFVWGS